MKKRLVLWGACMCALATLTGCSTSGASASKDVTISACTPSPTGGRPAVSGRLLNHSSKSSLYTIHVKFTDASGNGAGDAVAAVAKVDSGTTANWHASGTVSAKGPLKCALSSVTRNFVP